MRRPPNSTCSPAWPPRRCTRARALVPNGGAASRATPLVAPPLVAPPPVAPRPWRGGVVCRGGGDAHVWPSPRKRRLPSLRRPARTLAACFLCVLCGMVGTMQPLCSTLSCIFPSAGSWGWGGRATTSRRMHGAVWEEDRETGAPGTSAAHGSAGDEPVCKVGVCAVALASHGMEGGRVCMCMEGGPWAVGPAISHRWAPCGMCETREMCEDVL